MEDENGIELSLGLSCGGSASRLKAKDGGLDLKAEEGGNSKLMGGNLNVADATFKHFLQRGTEKPDSVGQQRIDFGTQQQENFWTDLGKCSTPEVNTSTDMHENGSQFPQYRELWVTNNRTAGVLEEKSDQHELGGNLWPEACNKRKMSFEEINHQKKHGREVDHSDTLVNPSNFQLAFGYSPVQLPTMEMDSTWGVGSHPQQFAAYVSRSLGDGVANTEQSEDDLKISQAAAQDPHSFSEGLPYERKASELARGCGKQHASDEAGMSSSTQGENDAKANNTIFRPKEISDQPVVEGFAHEGSVIRPGIAGDVKFGGCGSYPDLPWVSATGSGPNGKTISGVTYRYSKNEIRYVCACHGSHMSRDEFIQHASAEVPNPENNTGLPSFPSNNPAASAQS